MANLSKQKRERMIEFLEQLKENNKTNDDVLIAIGEIENEINSKKYGLVWERHDEEVEIKMADNVPVFTEDPSREIIKNSNKKCNFILEGDNLHSLYLLQKTHKGAIDFIYIDPPYNMGKKSNDDFKYNDNIVSGEDYFRHSKWLSFMERRLNLAKNLMSKEGIIFISIDENELANLTLLCNQIFGEQNYISSCFVLDNLKGKANDNFVTSVGSRLLIYAKNKQFSDAIGFNEIENVFGNKIENTYKQEDELGFYNLITFKKTGQSKYREDRPFMFYPILEKSGVLYSISDEEFSKLYDKDAKKFNDEFLKSLKAKYKDYNFILPLDSNGDYLRWTSGFQTFVKKMNSDIVYDGGVKQKNRPEANEMLQEYVSGTPKSFMYKSLYANGTGDLKKVLPDSNFPFPKPVELMKDIIKLYPKKDMTVLDFFGGSGTTAQAVLEVNQEDGGNRNIIICTNNENGICDNDTYPRIATIITGKRPDKSKYSNGVETNLKLYLTDFVSKDEEYLADSLLEHVKEMIQLEHGVNVDGNNYVLILSEEEADELEKHWKEHSSIKGIYLSRNVLLSTSQTELFSKVEMQIIPDYYFDFELKELGETW